MKKISFVLSAIACSVTMVLPSFVRAADWVSLSVPALDSTYYRAVSAVGDTVVAFGSYGSVRSTDGGKTWSAEVSYSGSSSPTMQTGIMYGTSAVATGVNGDISLSVDSGTSWTAIRSPLTDDMNAIAKYHTVFPSSYALYAVGDSGAVMKSTDGGYIWSDVSVRTSGELHVVGAASATTVWVAGDSGAIYKTTNGGTSWTAEDLSTSFDIHSISVIDQNHVWVGGEGEFLSYTADGGSTWTQVTPTDKHIIGDIDSLAFLNSTEGYMTRSGRCMWHTTDAGATWSTQDESCGIEYDMVTVSSDDTVYAIGHSTEKVLQVYDDVAPTVGAVSATQSVTGTSGTFSVTADDDFGISACTAKVNGVSAGTLVQQGSSSTFALTYTFSTSGSKALSATCVDDGGNSTTGSSSTITIAESGSTSIPVVGDLIKTACATYHDVNDPCTAVYYVGSDGMRHAFTNEKVFFSWYTDFDDVVTVSTSTMSSYIIGHNVTYKPGVTMVKFVTLRTVFAVEQGGILHGIDSEALAAALYGSDWNTADVDDISDTFYRDYSIGSTIASTADYNVSAALFGTATIDENF